MEKKEREKLENIVAERKKKYAEGWSQQIHPSSQGSDNGNVEEVNEEELESMKVKIGNEKSVTIKKFLDRYEANRGKRTTQEDIKTEPEPGKKKGINLKEFFEKQRKKQEK